MGRGGGRRGSFETLLQRKVVESELRRTEEKKNPALEPPLIKGLKRLLLSAKTERRT
jgi:hypothetical protein